MAAKKTSKGSKPGNWSTELVSFKFDAETRKQFESYYKNNVELHQEDVDNVFRSAHKMGVSFQPEQDAYVFSITCRDESSDNHNKCLTFWVSDYLKGLAAVGWLIVRYFEYDDWSGATDTGIL